MASGSNEITLYGVLVGAILPLLGYIIFHRLASHREKESRLASASNDYREKMIKSTSLVPSAETYWDNNVLEQLPEVLTEINLAVNVYAYFLSESRKAEIQKTLNEIQKIIENEIPQALSKENVMYGGGQHTPEEARNLFHKHAKKLISYAKKT